MTTETQNFIRDYMIQTDIQLLAEVETELYNKEYLVIGYNVCNAGVTFDEAIFINDLEEEHYNDQSQIFLVSEVSDSSEEINEAIAERLNKLAQNEQDEKESYYNV